MYRNKNTLYIFIALIIIVTTGSEKRSFPDYLLNNKEENSTQKSLKVLTDLMTTNSKHMYVRIENNLSKSKNRFYVVKEKD